MKTSTIFIILAVLVTLGCLTAYNVKLKEIYDSKAYKNPYRYMEFTSISGIENLKIHSANAIGLEIQQGDKEGIWISKSTRIKKEVKDNTLSLDLLRDSVNKETFVVNGIVIITKKLKSIVTTPGFKGNGGNEPSSQMFVSNYTLDQLDLKMAPNTIVDFNNVKANVLNATIGNETQGAAQLNIGSNNTFNVASFNIPGSGVLRLSDPKITKVIYNLSDRAEVSLSGKVLDVIKK